MVRYLVGRERPWGTLMVTLIVVVSVLFIVGFIGLNIVSDRNFQRRREQMIQDKIARREQQTTTNDSDHSDTL